jgi:hypothetical protein
MQQAFLKKISRARSPGCHEKQGDFLLKTNQVST